MAGRRDLPCAVCGDGLEPVEADLPDQPHGANIFATTGHYGATAFDSPGGDHLELLICTPCLHAMARRQVIHRVLAAAGDTAEQRLVWGSPEDEAVGATPWDTLNLANQRRLEACAATPGMTPQTLERLWDACREATQDGKVFDPLPATGDVPSWEGQELPDLQAATMLRAWLRYQRRTLTGGIEAGIAAADLAIQAELARIFEVANPGHVVQGGWRCEKSPTGGCVYDRVEDPWHDNCLVCGEPSDRG